MKSGKNTTFIREINQKNVLNIIRKNPVSRSEIARETGLTKPAISSIVEILIKNEFVEEIGLEGILRGRHPELLSLKSDSHYAIGVDISRNSCSAGVCDFSGKRVSSFTIEISNLPPVIAIKKICVNIHEHLIQEKIPYEKLIGIGINVPGPVDTLEGEILTPPNFAAWHNFNIVEPFRDEFNLLTLVENDSTAYALAENLYGHGKKFNNYMMLVLVDGVGSSLILNGKPYRGQRGLNPEMGHVSINIFGEQCQCGKKGCLELYTSIPRIIQKAKQAGINISSWDEIIDKALAQDSKCLDIIKEQANFLAFAIGNITNIFAPEAVILSGDVQYKSDLLLNFIKNEAYGKVISKGIPTPQILMSQLQKNKAIIAASSIIFSDFLYL